MKGQPSDRAVMLGEYILEQKATVRATAAQFGISKSTVHKDVSERLPLINPDLYAGVKAILEQNKQERHIRGGLATKRKYAMLAQQHHIQTASISSNISHHGKKQPYRCQMNPASLPAALCGACCYTAILCKNQQNGTR